MTIIQLDIPNEEGQTVTVSAVQLTEHLAAAPCIMVNRDTDELSLNAAVWMVCNVPSGRLVTKVQEEDPHEWPGQPRAIDLEKVRAFAEWLEPQCDWDSEDRKLTKDAARQIGISRDYINGWTAPPDCEQRGKPNACKGTRLGVTKTLCIACEELDRKAATDG
ncbi:Uncharacterised protein [Mycobacteroides abscessus subsp. massiliense]|uniref:hypothetical protein n=1 Tax=Mycobacteroides abscessus TaxID=36809 RepID=UPI0009A84498|nr:hypothetical protein [Mycobacteroides abscessus]SKM82241.1 Uncharacterised protein [Mycobacteroides abscessus subsp. massiliense]SKM98955.1 Uncharacterised protein [Mycobacteroides abscessus subsp. massiliense]SKN77545.1 Uncharacterised protein [Mycobacteroides abscessus subsp. massiliense]SKN95646.1 Uncharacterised protein [Mycobacteroides abscessus subsp. massiliense]SKO22812.1 Uncharacterised protein [Mycobacteroides abscessus subsp. massiliense]